MRKRTQFYQQDGTPIDRELTDYERIRAERILPKPLRPWRKSTKYDPKFAKAAYNLIARHGFTWRELAPIFGVVQGVILNWKNREPAFAAALIKGRDDYDLQCVERSLVQRAIGYTHPEDKVFCNAAGEVTIVPTVKHYPPDPLSMIFLLKNRHPDRWRDVKAIDLNSNKVADKLDALSKVIRQGPAILQGDVEDEKEDGEE